MRTLSKEKPTPEYCRDCKHVKTEFITRRTCKLNCVGRIETDTCCWSGKRYPSRFEKKEPDNSHQSERDNVLGDLRNRLFVPGLIHPDSPEGKTIKRIIEDLRSKVV